jgi:D-3-phosphoglycerate dehydrogenase
VKRPKILVFATSFTDELCTMPDRTGEAAARLEKAAAECSYEVELRSDRNPSAPLDPAELESAEAVIADLETYDRELLSKVGRGAGGSLQLISRYGTGYNNVDIAAAREFGVTVTNTPGVNALPMAEWALATLIDVAGRRVQQHERASIGARKEGPSRIDISDKRIGIVGTGYSGKHLAAMLSCFTSSLYAYAPRPDYEWAEQAGVRYVELDELCESCDFISLHASADRQIIGQRQLSLMKETTVLVNCARNILVDSRAVWRAVRDGGIFGYGIDEVWEHEDLPLYGINIIASPHVASDTDRGKLGMQLGSVQAVESFLRGETPENCIT